MNRWSHILSTPHDAAAEPCYYTLSEVVSQPCIYDVLLQEGEVRGAVEEAGYHLNPHIDEQKLSRHAVLEHCGVLIGESTICALVYNPLDSHYHVMRRVSESELKAYFSLHLPSSNALSPLSRQLRSALVQQEFDALLQVRQPFLFSTDGSVYRIRFNAEDSAFVASPNIYGPRIKQSLSFPYDYTLTLRENLYQINAVLSTLTQRQALTEEEHPDGELSFHPSRACGR